MQRQRLRQLLAGVVVLAVAYLLAVHVTERWQGRGGPAITQRQAEAILAELQALERRLGSADRAQPATVTVSVAQHPALGRTDAPVTLVEFTDYQCPYCSRFHRETFPALRSRFIETGKVRYVVLDLPLPMHGNAQLAAQAAHCAGEQQRFFALHDLLFEHHNDLAPARLRQLAREAGVKLAPFEDCLADGRYLKPVRQSGALAAALGIRGTPTFIIGPTRDDGTVQGRKLVGAHPAQVFAEAIELALTTVRREGSS